MFREKKKSTISVEIKGIEEAIEGKKYLFYYNYS